MGNASYSPDTTYKHELITPKCRGNFYCWFMGGLILMANKIRHAVQGYLTPRTFPVTDYARAINYDISVLNSWLHYLRDYTDSKVTLQDMNILELGPGADLGIGLLLLANGANRYCSLDVNNLVVSVPQDFYETLFSHIEQKNLATVDIATLRTELHLTHVGKNRNLNYVCDPEFNLMQFQKDEINLVFSQAAFEHFDNIPSTFSQLSRIVKSGGILIVEIDLSTHTRWIRDFDPLNIYRYSEPFYRALHFPGSPNRVRPHQYKQYLEDLGWKNVRVIPRRVTDENYVKGIKNHIASDFRKPADEIGMLSIILCATR